MKKTIILSILFLLPFSAHASSFTLGTGSETCFQYGVEVSYSTDISSPEVHFGILGGNPDHGKISLSTGSGSFSWSTVHDDALPARPFTVSGITIYSGADIVYTDSRQYVVQTDPCTDSGAGTVTDDNKIHFETYQALSFTLAASLFTYFVIALLTWFFERLKPRRPLRR